MHLQDDLVSSLPRNYDCDKEDDVDLAIKIIVVGDGAVGKSSLIQRYCCGTFKHNYCRTIGADFLERRIKFNGRKVQLMLWDTAGQEEFAAITRVYYRGASCCVLAFSTTDHNSLDAVSTWNEKVTLECGVIPTVLVQTKIDLLGQPLSVEQSEVESVANALDVRLFRTSALEDHNIDSVFQTLAQKYVELVTKTQTVPVPLSRDMFGAADKLRRGDTIVLRSKKNKFKYNFYRSMCRLV